MSHRTSSTYPSTSYARNRIHQPSPGPIRAQPKAATITIPGIHTREVMALGSEPKSSKALPLDEQQQTSRIQSIYRLLQGTTCQGEAPNTREETSVNRSSRAFYDEAYPTSITAAFADATYEC
ncbi:hypothetical protein K439DRAFT_1629371 [Ramaria rubella]|nr:hypothetical protein K439DRAFT_1629371 [Ramaria rubella]